MVSYKFCRCDTELLKTIKYRIFIETSCSVLECSVARTTCTQRTILTLQQSVWGTACVRWLPAPCRALSPPLCLAPTSTGPGIAHRHPQKALPSQAFLLVEQPTDLPGGKGDRTRPRDVHSLHLSTGRWGGRDGAAAGDLWLPPALMLPAAGTWDRGAGVGHSAPGEKGKHTGSRREKLTGEKEAQSPSSPCWGKCELWGLQDAMSSRVQAAAVPLGGTSEAGWA